MTLYQFAIGLAMTPTNLESLATPVTPPKSTFSPYSLVKELSDGSMRGIGAPIATWHWGVLKRPMRNQLRTFCPGASAEVYIRTYTKDNNGAPKYYKCQMFWPVEDEETYATRAVDFKIEFKQLIIQADP